MTDKPCPKCGGPFGEPRYCSGSVFHCLHNSDWRYNREHHLEHLVFTCERCHYEELRATLAEIAAKNP